jgi:hypothetical protein
MRINEQSPKTHLPLVGRSNRRSAEREAVRVGGWMRTVVAMAKGKEKP